MLQKSKSKNVLQLKYLLLVPLVFGILVYTSCEKEAKLNDDTELSSKDEVLIARLNEKLGNSKENLIITYHSDLFEKFQSDDYILTKEEFFEHELSIRKIVKGMKEKAMLENPDSKSFDFEMPLPSESRYQAYIKRKKAFQLLDPNLKQSIKAYNKEVSLIQKSDDYPSGHLELKVSYSKKLTSSELRKFNGMLLDLELPKNKNTTIVITDNTHTFHVYRKVYKNAFDPLEDTFEMKEEIDYNNGSDILVPFSVIEEVPVFPGCENAGDKRACFNEKIQKHISKNFNYPQAAQEAGIQGKVNVMFVIQENGSIDGLRMRGPDKLLEDEVERIVKKLPNMTPGKHEGSVVSVPFSIPITFKLQ